MSLTTHSLTYDDLARMPDDGNRYEIIAGVLCVSPSPTEVHQAISFRLTLLVGNFVTAERLGKVYAAPFDVRLSEQDVVQPDLIFVSRSRLSIISPTCIEGAPDLLVEILSPSTRDRDRTRKARRYAMSGVPQYWLVDPDARTVTVLSLERGTYRALPKEQGVVRSAVQEGFEIDSATVFATLVEEG
ncbi:MAG: Uma2 family endonuclease [Chloroflexota bacterium]|nr:Uma2 family endonuclease [Chloroflexota bacterium]